MRQPVRKRNSRLMICFTKDELASVSEYAEKHRLGTSTWVRALILAEIDKAEAIRPLPAPTPIGYPQQERV